MTFGSFLAFVFSASLPVLFVRAVSCWIEADYLRSNQGREQEHGGLGQDNWAKSSYRTFAELSCVVIQIEQQNDGKLLVIHASDKFTKPELRSS